MIKQATEKKIGRGDFCCDEAVSSGGSPSGYMREALIKAYGGKR
jgi:hypothetical protein